MLTALQCHLAFHPMRELEGSPAEAALRFEDVRLTTDDGVKLHGWYVPADSPGGATLLFFHGNAGNISHRVDSIALFHELGLNVLIIDYRGYGRSQGRPGEKGTYADAEAAWRYLTEHRDVKPEQIVIFGRSLGGAVAVELATRHTPAALIVESTFTSGADMARRMAPWFPRWLIFLRYDSLQRIGQVHCPVLIVHSRDDEMIPFEQGRRLFAAAPSPKEFLELEGGHNEGYLLCLETYRRTLRAFLGRHVVLTPS